MKAKQIENFLMKNGAAILGGIASVGVVATAITSSKAAPKALSIIDDFKECNEKKEKAKKLYSACKCYFPTVVMVAGTIGCIAGAGVISQKAQASLAATCLMLNTSFANYRKKVNELFGEEADLKVREAISHEKYEQGDMTKSDETVLFHDLYSDQWFESTIVDVQAAEYHFNRNFILRGYASINELYEFYGIDPWFSPIDRGWSNDAGDIFYGYHWVDFEHIEKEKEDGTKYYDINLPFPPTTDYMDPGDYVPFIEPGFSDPTNFEKF